VRGKKKKRHPREGIEGRASATRSWRSSTQHRLAIHYDKTRSTCIKMTPMRLVPYSITRVLACWHTYLGLDIEIIFEESICKKNSRRIKIKTLHDNHFCQREDCGRVLKWTACGVQPTTVTYRTIPSFVPARTVGPGFSLVGRRLSLARVTAWGFPAELLGSLRIPRTIFCCWLPRARKVARRLL
jgi:hypothetical protein